MAEWMAIIEGKTNLPSEIYDTQNLLWHLPLSTMDRKFGWKSSIWKDWLNHSSSDEFWKETFYQDKLKNIHIPVLHISGWYDDDLIGTYINFSTISNNISLDQKNYQKLIIGPWQHKVNRSQKIGDIDFGNSAIIDLRKIELDWFDRFLKGINNGIDNDLPVEIFVMGENKWRKEKTFPIENTKYIPYYIHSNGKANSSEGDGTLNIKIPDDEPYDQYIYDPSDPVRCILDPNDISAEGPFDQSSLERRKDVLVYQTDVLKEEIEVTGPIKMRLYVSSDAIDTDFWVQLTDVFSTGYSMHLTENIIRCGYRFGLEKFIPLKPNEITECNVDLWAISNLFKKRT
ncbi:MAG: CocE/NonD family hydrolase [Caldisphaera sp.]